MSHQKVLEFLGIKDSLPLKLDTQKSALLVIDMQCYFVRANYPFAKTLEAMTPGVTHGYFERIQNKVVPNIQKLQEAFRVRKLPIFYTGTGTARADRSDLAGWLRGFDAAGEAMIGRFVWPEVNDPAWRIDDGVAPAPGEIVVNKTSAGAFASTELHRQFQGHGIATLIICGTSTDVCVTTTARDAADLGYEVIVVEDACTTLSEQMHEESLNAIRLAFGRVRSTADVIALLSPTVATAPTRSRQAGGV